MKFTMKLLLLITTLLVMSPLFGSSQNTSKVGILEGDVYEFVVDQLVIEGDLNEDKVFGSEDLDFTQFSEGTTFSLTIDDDTLTDNNEIEITISSEGYTDQTGLLPLNVFPTSPIVFTDWTYWKTKADEGIEGLEFAADNTDSEIFRINTTFVLSVGLNTISTFTEIHYDKATGVVNYFYLESDANIPSISKDYYILQEISLTDQTLVERPEPTQGENNGGETEDAGLLPGFEFITIASLFVLVPLVKRRS